MADSIRNSFKPFQDQAKTYLENQGHKPKVFTLSHLSAFFSNIPVTINLIREEPEILFFVVSQWVVVCLAYFAWLQMLQWIPDEVWNEISKSNNEETRKNAFSND